MNYTGIGDLWVDNVNFVVTFRNWTLGSFSKDAVFLCTPGYDRTFVSHMNFTLNNPGLYSAVVSETNLNGNINIRLLGSVAFKNVVRFQTNILNLNDSITPLPLLY
jgi:hypothetical protein